MTPPPSSGDSPDRPPDLETRLLALGRRLGEREASHRDGIARARACVEALRTRVEPALERFHRAAAQAGAPHLRVELSGIRTDDKHLRALQFDLRRGRHRALVTARSRGDVTLVGPFRDGKVEGPCASFPIDAHAEIDQALSDLLERFLEEASTP